MINLKMTQKNSSLKAAAVDTLMKHVPAFDKRSSDHEFFKLDKNKDGLIS